MITYKWTNTLNGKFYIGSTVNIKRRTSEHFNSKEKYPFQSALRKKPDAFELETWEDDCDDPVLEQALLDMWFGTEQCYNLNPAASRPPVMFGKDNHMYGKSPSEETRRKNSEAHRGKKQSEETRKKKSEMFSGEGNPMYGRKQTEEALQKIKEAASKNNKGERNPNFGVPCSDEKRKKISDSLVGKKYWVNARGEVRCQYESPGPEWQNGRKWRKGKT